MAVPALGCIQSRPTQQQDQNKSIIKVIPQKIAMPNQIKKKRQVFLNLLLYEALWGSRSYL